MRWALPLCVASLLILATPGVTRGQFVEQGRVKEVWTLRHAVESVEPPDPIRSAQVLELAERTFPNLATQLESAELLERAAADPSVRGNLRGRLAEEIFERAQASEGWRRVANPNATQNDFWNAKLQQGAQIKVHADIDDYHRSMRKDHLAERFVVPDDHFEILKRNLSERREGALRGGNSAKAEEYARQEQRLTKLGRTFRELDDSITTAHRHFRQVAVAMKQVGIASSFIAATAMIVEGGIAIYQFSQGKKDAEAFAVQVGKIGITGAIAWQVGPLAAKAAMAAGASGLGPVAVGIVVAGATVLVVDWAFDASAESLSIATLSAAERDRLWQVGSPIEAMRWQPL